MIYHNVLISLSILSVSVSALQEGSPCTDADGYPGVCRDWRRCFNLIVDHLEYTYPPVCSYDGSEPVVCCTSCKLVEDVSKAVINPQGGFLWKTEQKSWNQCIDYFIDLPYEFKDNQKGTIHGKKWNNTAGCYDMILGVVAAAGGHDASRAEYPHMALLGYGPREQPQYLCGGSVISEHFILTAGHCVSASGLGPVSTAALGILKRSDPEHLWQRYSIQEIIRQPQYRPPSKYHDIALLKTRKRIMFNINVMPACLPNMERPLHDEEAFATGWGTLGPGTDLADTLQKVTLQQFSNSRCSGQYPKHRHLTRGYDHGIQMCYGNRDVVRDTCKGDSGGPLQVWGQIHITQYTIIGVTSYGAECGHAGRAGVYTRLAPYVTWIDAVVWK